MTVQDKVREFHDAFKLGSNTEPTMIPWPLEVMRETILQEEVLEYHDALNMPRGKGPRNRTVEIADALGDIVYIAYGTAVATSVPSGAKPSAVPERWNSCST